MRNQCPPQREYEKWGMTINHQPSTPSSRLLDPAENTDNRCTTNTKSQQAKNQRHFYGFISSPFVGNDAMTSLNNFHKIIGSSPYIPHTYEVFMVKKNQKPDKGEEIITAKSTKFYRFQPAETKCAKCN